MGAVRAAAPRRVRRRLRPVDAPRRAPRRPVSRTTRRRTRRSRASPSSGSGPGTVPFDAWYPYLGLGSPQFLQYQALSHIVTGLLSIVFGDATFRWTNYLLICTWPISVYIGARLLGLDRWQAGAAALVLADARQRRGLRLRVGQLRVARQRHVVDAVGALAHADRDRPGLARGREGRAVRARRRSSSASRARCTSSPAISCCSRSACSCSCARPQALKRLGRGALVGLGGLLIFAFIFVPTLGGLKYVNVNSFQVGTFWQNSYGPGKVLHVALRRRDSSTTGAIRS